ncbi:MAG: hypothetical protein Unbinned4388contig1000_31 [Prokaryotic dsDNA virus sp.]|nr:MAG: hypothetical protein Unbinned4388contig1000_31 [Prokaryotic dsDNA virus sp.]|tara:strand:- start:54334 stop:54543 length:210 start_codon:yes stop_codon:yes gene_type:complete
MEKKTYYNCGKIRKAIGDVMKENAIARTNLGSDSTLTEKREAVAAEKRSLKAIRHLDPEYVDVLLAEHK